MMGLVSGHQTTADHEWAPVSLSLSCTQSRISLSLSLSPRNHHFEDRQVKQVRQEEGQTDGRTVRVKSARTDETVVSLWRRWRRRDSREEKEMMSSCGEITGRVRDFLVSRLSSS